MRQSAPDQATENWYFRLTMWSNRHFARLVTLIANFLQFVARPLPVAGKRRIESLAKLLKNLADLIVRPYYVRQFIQWRPQLKGMIDGGLLGGLLGYWTGYYLVDKYVILNIFVLLAGLVIIILVMLLVTFLSVSGDVYLDKQDEFQKAVANQASAFTLRIVTILLFLLFVVYVFFPTWRDAVPFHLSMLFCVGRILYLSKLTELRWHELAILELEESEELEMAEE